MDVCENGCVIVSITNEIIQKRGFTAHCIAFRANSQNQVEQFYEAALAADGKCNGTTGLRPQYTETYYVPS